MKIDTFRIQLDKLNENLAGILGMESIPLFYQTGEAEQDTLFLYGIVGGKDVGKTALINQLAGATISLDTDLLDEGTQEATAYCHRQDAAALHKRFSAEAFERIKYVHHDRNELKNVVIIDMPDFDSRFRSHIEDTRQLSRHLQGLIWVTTPRKYGDHELLSQLETIAQSHENYFIVLNKIDQLEDKASLDTVKQEITTYLSKQCIKRNVPPPKPSHFFVISALARDRYEFIELRDRLIRHHSLAEITQAKNKNLLSEFRKNLERMNSHYALSERVKEIDRAREKTQEYVATEFSDDYFETVQRRIASLEVLRRRISGTLFAHKIEGWPILRLLVYPLAGIVSGFGGRLVFPKTGNEWYDTTKDLLRFEGQPASLRMQKIRISIENLFPDLKKDLGDIPDFPKLIEEKFDQFLNSYEDHVTDRLIKSTLLPGSLKKISIYLPLIWFPFLQPICLHLAGIKAPMFSLSSLKDLYAILISLFGASSLLVSLVFLLLFYTVWLILIYAQSARKVKIKGEEEFKNLWYSQLLTWIAETLSQPLTNMRARLTYNIVQLEQIESSIKALTGSISNRDSLPTETTPSR